MSASMQADHAPTCSHKSVDHAWQYPIDFDVNAKSVTEEDRRTGVLVAPLFPGERDTIRSHQPVHL
jgi:hypothetical protein